MIIVFDDLQLGSELQCLCLVVCSFIHVLECHDNDGVCRSRCSECFVFVFRQNKVFNSIPIN
ncbi:hypothetical protein Scep_006949 [Stephania cephalantha]|uniref:Uncharacterized protein n=1 Tax=Stephania cephalantha TaxID=152367 RepID=A0AAP0PLB1_9MAGN